MKVPFLDLKAQYKAVAGEISEAIREVFEGTAFSGGPFVVRFEEQFASFCGARHAIGVGSGTEALWLTLLAQGIGPGDEVITVPNTFIATAEAITLCGARPVFVDIDEQSYTMNPSLVAAAITSRTKAIIPVHLYGQMADMDPLLELAAHHGIAVIEDACQAHGAEYKGARAGSLGLAGCFSFYPGKNLGAYGEAGAVVTNNRNLAEKIRMLRDHGQSEKYYHELVGVNGRMDGIQGAVLSVKLKYLASWNHARIRNAQLYGRLLADLDTVVLPVRSAYAHHVYHIFAIRVAERKRFLAAMAEKGIACGIHYPVPLHLQKAYADMGLKRGSFPVAERCSDQVVSLPLYPELSSEQIQYVAEAVRETLRAPLSFLMDIQQKGSGDAGNGDHP